ncbi:DNA-directed RNA polymerase III subunit RPC3 [Trichogramma pretiosum]|uniref:DNA-directed RNA polymerase III subunit RPC3 n=1 Tax=Trichogramma pretiosum TaxID=7493 RepID=UPI0006C975D7|nr:DNA-directed RNA polymerase III subunit RPC3 [Trichogramma pretiosum]
MSALMEKLCRSLLMEHFGAATCEVGCILFKYGPKTMTQFANFTKLPANKIVEALYALIKFDIVAHEKLPREVLYSIDIEKIFLLLRHHRYTTFVKKNMYDEAEMLFDVVLKNGYDTASQIIVKTYTRLEQNPPERRASIPLLLEKFELLVKNQFIIRHSVNNDANTDAYNFIMPSLHVKDLIQLSKNTNVDTGDQNIFWKINFDRFTQDLRNEILVNTITKRFDDNAGELMKRLLILMDTRTAAWEDTSIPIAFNEIKEDMKKNFPSIMPRLDQYIKVLEEDSCKFIMRVGDSGGGQYTVNMKEAFHQLAWATIENVVMERFGSKAARIFRLVRSCNYIEMEKIQQKVMFPPKETKHITYKLTEENYLHYRDFKKSGTNAPKTFYLFHIDLDEVVRMTIEHCYHAIYSAIYRRNDDLSKNKRLIDKEWKITTLVKNFRELGATPEQIANVEDQITPSEKAHLNQLSMRVEKLSTSECQVDDTLFVLQMYIRYHKSKLVK